MITAFCPVCQFLGYFTCNLEAEEHITECETIEEGLRKLKVAKARARALAKKEKT